MLPYIYLVWYFILLLYSVIKNEQDTDPKHLDL